MNLFITITILIQYTQFIGIKLSNYTLPLYIYNKTNTLFTCNKNNWLIITSNYNNKQCQESFQNNQNKEEEKEEEEEEESIFWNNNNENNENNELLIGYNVKKQYFYIPPSNNICFKLVNNEIVLIISRNDNDNDNDNYDTEEILNCLPKIHLKYALTFDPYLLLNISSISSIFSNYDINNNSPIICASIEESIFDYKPNYFTIISNFDLEITSFPFWLNLCKIHSKIITIHQRSKQNYLSTESYCLVDKVVAIDQFTNESYSNPAICIEDIFTLLSNPSSKSIFISSLGLDYLVSNKYSQETETLRHISDINSMIIAFQNTLSLSPIIHSLHIQSILKGLIKFLDENLTNLQLLPEILTTLTFTNDYNTWKLSFDYFTFHFTQWFGDSIYSSTKESDSIILIQLVNKNILIYHLINILDQFTPNQNEKHQISIISSNYMTRFLFGEILTRYYSYLTNKNNLIPFSSLSSFSLMRNNLNNNILKRQSLFYNSIHEIGKLIMNDDFIIKSPFCKSYQILSLIESNYSVVSSTAHILVFVSIFELDKTQQLLQKWRENCQHCPLVTEFVIYTIQSSLNKQEEEKEGKERKEEKEELNIMNSTKNEYRKILLKIQDYVDHLVVDSDIITILIGYSSMKSFIQPGKNGLIPQPEIGNISYFRLFNTLVFSSQHKIDENELICHEINLNSFVATSHQIIHFLNYIFNHQLSGFSDNLLRFLTFQYIFQFQDTFDIRIDSNFLLFNYLSDNNNNDNNNVDSNQNNRNLDVNEITNLNSNDITDLNIHTSNDIIINTLNKAYTTFLSTLDFVELFNTVVQHEFQMGDNLYGLGLMFYLVQIDHIEMTKGCSELIHQSPRNFKFISYLASVENKRNLIQLTQIMLDNLLNDRIILTPLDIRNSFISSLRRFLQVVNWHLGDIKTAVELYKDDLFPTLSYSKVLIEREEWNKYRERIKSNLIPNFQKHFVTYANYYNPGLHNLLYSARLADVELKILGSGETWIGFQQRVQAYYEFLYSPDVSDDDIALFFDGFDVLLLPSIKYLEKEFVKFSTPIVACSENGPHIDRPSAWYYKTGINNSTNGASRMKFINGGCLLGRVKNMKTILGYILNHMTLNHFDDQLSLMNFYFHFPHLISIDYYHKIFLCVYKLVNNSIKLSKLNGKLILNDIETEIGLVHFNSGMTSDTSNIVISELAQYQDYLDLINQNISL